MADKTWTRIGKQADTSVILYIHICVTLSGSFSGTAKHCCICIPGRACVEHLVDLHAAPLAKKTQKASSEPMLHFPQQWW